MDSAFLDRESRFLDRFAQGRMGVHGTSQIFRTPAKFHYGDCFCD